MNLLLALLAWCCAWAGTVTVDVLDIGQGDSILIRTPAKKTILIDAGDGKVAVAPMLKELGVDHLDLVIATHPHADHIGGMNEVLLAFPPKIYVDNGLPHTTQTYSKLMKTVEDEGLEYRAAVKGTVFNLDDGAALEILNPADTVLKDTRSDLNANSVVTRLTHGKDCLLFVGDSEEPTEHLLLDGGIGQCDVLKVAHHGSRHSSVDSFLSAVQPKYALISVGRPNRYRHPGSETLERLRHVGATVYRTDLQGRITVLSSGQGVSFTTERTATPEELFIGGDVGYTHRDGAVEGAGEGVAAATAALGTVPGLPLKGDADLKAGGTPTAPGTATESRVQPSAPPTSPPPPPLPTAGKESTEAPSTVDPTAAPNPRESAACAFVASKRSEVFHEASCGNGLKIAETNLVCYPTREAALADAKRPAGCCHP